MEQLVDQISNLEVSQLGTRDFQAAVLAALGELMKEQESLRTTLVILARTEEKENLEELEKLISDESSNEEWEISDSSAIMQSLRNNTLSRIQHHHQRKLASDESLADEDLDQDKICINSQYKWKKKMLSNHFGGIIRQDGRMKPRCPEEDVNHHQMHVPEALEKLEEVLGLKTYPGKTISDKDFTFLVSKPDGLIDDDKLVIVKCPKQCENRSLESLAKSDKQFCLQILNNILQLSSDHDYYYQVQGDLRICDKELCYFVVWTQTEFYYQPVQRDRQVWDGVMVHRLKEFYRNCIIDEKWRIPDISEEEFKCKCSEVLDMLKTSSTLCASMEHRTRGKANSLEWGRELKWRLIDYHFGRICKLPLAKSCHDLVISLLYPEQLEYRESLFGQDDKRAAIKDLNGFLAKDNLHVEDCGLFVEMDNGFLAAVPDGVVGKDALVNLHCPTMCSDKTLEDLARTDPSFCLEQNQLSKKLGLKKTHNYHYQIQGQMHISKRLRCYFMVWSRTEYHLEMIAYDSEFWEDMEQRLVQFYMNCLLPEIADPRAPRGLKVRDPDYILQAQNMKSLQI